MNNQPTRSQKTMIARVIFTLQKAPKLNTHQIQDILLNYNLPCYSPQTLLESLKELQMMGIVNCEIIRKKTDEPQTITDHFSLTKKADNFVEQIQATGISSGRKRQVSEEEKFVILKCQNCNSYRYAGFPFKKIQCFSCDQIFKLSDIVLQVDTKEEAISFLKELKSSFNRSKTE